MLLTTLPTGILISLGFLVLAGLIVGCAYIQHIKEDFKSSLSFANVKSKIEKTILEDKLEAEEKRNRSLSLRLSLANQKNIKKVKKKRKDKIKILKSKEILS